MVDACNLSCGCKDFKNFDVATQITAANLFVKTLQTCYKNLTNIPSSITKCLFGTNHGGAVILLKLKSVAFAKITMSRHDCVKFTANPNKH